MSGNFFGLNVAVRGLYTAQRSLDIVNHNLNNVNTPGYSRQIVVQAASKPLSLYDGTGMLGTGSEALSVDRIRDEYLDFKYWSENVSYGEWDAKRTLLSDMEVTFNEPSSSGFTKIMDDFYSSLQELAKDPSSGAVRSLVRERGVTLSKYFNSLAAHFEKLQSDANSNVKTKVEEINSIASQVQQLNRQIYTSELDGNVANDLRDQRTVLVDRLSKIINIDASEVVVGKLPNGADDKHFVITISGKALVDHYNVSKLEAKARENKLNEEDIDNLYEVGWADGNQLEVKGGELKGYLDVRDGNGGQPHDPDYTGPLDESPLYKGIPFYMKKLNEFVRTFAKAFNEGYINGTDGAGHADGYALNSAEGDPVSGIRFFTMLGEDNKAMNSADFIDGATGMTDVSSRYDALTAKNFTVSSDIMGDYNLISSSGTAGQKGNIDNLNALMEMRHNTHMFTEGAPEDFMKSLVTTLGIDSQQAVSLTQNQSVIIKQIDNRRLSVSGVSIDEEMSNLVKFQHAYNAAAKMISTMAEVYDILINKLGVG